MNVKQKGRKEANLTLREAIAFHAFLCGIET